MGPTCEVRLNADDAATLDAIDGVLAAAAERIDRTRKGRVWDVWIQGRPVHVAVEETPAIILSAGCNAADDYAVLRRLASNLAAAVNGSASEPSK